MAEIDGPYCDEDMREWYVKAAQATVEQAQGEIDRTRGCVVEHGLVYHGVFAATLREGDEGDPEAPEVLVDAHHFECDDGRSE